MQILQSVVHPQELTGRQQADYCLLLSQAMDKNHLSLNDSLLQIALAYYADRSDLTRKAMSYFYKGRYHYTQGEFKEATLAFKEAEKWAVADANDDLTSIIFNSLGYINKNELDFDKALSYFKQSFRVSEKMNNIERAVYNLQEIANVFFYMEQPDSVLHYHEQLISKLELCNNDQKAYVYHCLGIFHIEHGSSDKALEYLQCSLHYNDEEIMPYTYAALADLYAKEGDSEKTTYYLQKLGSIDNGAFNITVLESKLSFLLRTEASEEIALVADSLVSAIQDAYNSILDRNISEIQEKYDNKSLKMKHELMQYQLGVLFMLFVFLSLLIFYFYRRYKNKREAAIREKIRSKEAELMTYRLQLQTLEDEMNQGEEERQYLLARHNELEEKIRTKTHEIASYVKLQTSLSQYEKELEYKSSVLQGIEIYRSLLDGENRILQKSDFQHLIIFYTLLNPYFMGIVNNHSSSDIEKIISILYKAGLSRERIAAALSQEADSITRRKNRMKNKGFDLDQLIKLG
ncbi:hypothetical protein [Bacteroides sp. 214]|uniref:hypothetical protein n=1 Tax=Bacteroides sp. 214 TaxID=2302935 RepID=UPI0013D4F3D9|nr:hypothetical protein [Bacteroides sp. 214]